MSADLSGGDATPKLVKASIKDLTLAVNLIAYTFKTPDSMVAPDALQLDGAGNLALGGVPLLYGTFGRNFSVQDTGSVGVTLASTSGSAVFTARTNSTTGAVAALEFQDASATAVARIRYAPSQACMKIDMKNGASTGPVLRLNPTGELILGDTTGIVAKMMILSGITTVGGSEAGILVQSTSPGTIPSLINAGMNGTLQIAGGPAIAGQGRGGQIDFVAAGATTAPGALIFRAGTNTDGALSPEVGRWWPTSGALCVGTGSDTAAGILHVRALPGSRTRIVAEGLNDYPGLTMRRVNGTYAAPTAIKNADSLGFLNTHAWNGTGFGVSAGVYMQATEDWTPTAFGASITLNPNPNGSGTNILGMMVYHNGNVGINNSTPQSKFVVSATDGGNGYEVDTSAVINLRTLNRSTGVYQSVITRAQNHTWTCGTTGGTAGMLLEYTGTLAIGTINASGGAANTAIDAKLILANTPLSTALTIGDSGNGAPGIYSGMKIKVGTRHATDGGSNYFDITTRPADASNGVSGQADATMIRLESSISLTPRLLLQPGGNQVFVGDGTASSAARLVVQALDTGTTSGLHVLGKGATVSAPDVIISRTGAVASTAGLMPWLQFQSTDSSFAGNNAAAVGAAGNVFQVWSYISNAWIQKLTVNPTTTVTNNDVYVNAQTVQGLTIRGPGATNGNIVIQSNQGSGAAHWLSSKTDGSFHVGANGSTEPAMGTLSISADMQHAAFFGLNVPMISSTYGHGGTARTLLINNPDATVNAQGHLIIASGNQTLANSAIGGMSLVLPNISAGGLGRVANMGGGTDTTHTAANPVGYLSFATKNSSDTTATPRVVIRGSGNVVFGATSNDTARLYIYNEGRNVDGVRVNMADASTGNSSFVSERNDTVGFAMAFMCGGNIAGAITHPSVTTTVYGTGSDRRIKKNIVDAPSAGDVIDQMHVVSHDFIADNYHVSFGLIAQELNGVFPQAVVPGDNALDVGPNSKIWQVDPSKIVPLLVKEVQDVRKRLAEQEQKTQQLQDQLQMLLDWKASMDPK